MDDKKYWIGLSKIKGLGPIFISKLLKKFKTPKKIWEINQNELRKISGLGHKKTEKIISSRNKLNLDREMDKLKESNIKFVTLNDDKYPKLLKEIYDPPPVLYYKGNGNFHGNFIAIVGARRASLYGKKTAMNLASKLAARGITIVSGMARGIDSAGHKGAIRVSGNTIAVLASGVDYVYPPENNDLYKNILKSGLIISEFPPGVKPIPGYFPRRNRLISGLCQGVIVVEAAYKSGSLITSDFALEQGREVFAVPGNIDRTQSKGCNNLIKEGAKIVTSYQDVIEEMFFYDNTENNEVNYPELSKQEEKVIKIFQINNELYFDQIYEMTDIDKNSLSSVLLKLELKELIELNSSKKYVFKGLQKLLKPL